MAMLRSGLLQIVTGRIRESFQILISAPEFLVRSLQLVLDPARLFEQPRIVHGDCVLSGNAFDDGLVALG